MKAVRVLVVAAALGTATYGFLGLLVGVSGSGSTIAWFAGVAALASLIGALGLTGSGAHWPGRDI